MRHLLFCLLGATCLISNAHALDATYYHIYEDVSKKNIDQFGLGHTFKNNITIGWGVKAQANERADGKPGTAFSNDKIYERIYKIKYKYPVTTRYEIAPEFEIADKNESNKYKTKITNSFKFNDKQKIFLKYRYEIVKYDDTKKEDKHVHLTELGATQSVDRFKFTYAYGYYHADAPIYNNKDSDYKHQFTVDYKLTKKIAPYIEIRNESLSSKSKQRQTVFETGVQYTFF
ncbi:oligogalacturonate-specific porin KdgM family protein [Acinetobacter sp. HY1485]|uniref:oligogalacturonate-specific porin KdgM family protein n=1 Tax=Acinetobacter sp. HY1485 TaxID=2970918 RepID=UPI0022B958B9|nr:oligogalacturonate-specific porin KdgM family protein [Acinetobacter sp. HY1485]